MKMYQATLVLTCALTIAYMIAAGLIDDPRMWFVGAYGFGCAMFGILFERNQ